jgi:hypothetical protein
MLECLLLIGRGPRWAPFAAIPIVILISLAALRLIFLGLRGLITANHRTRRTSDSSHLASHHGLPGLVSANHRTRRTSDSSRLASHHL